MSSPCLKKIRCLHFFRQKLSAASRLPLGGRLLAKQGGEGQPNNNQAFSRQKASLYSTRVPGFPVGEAVGFCRLKRSLHVFPLSEKNSEPSFFFVKNCQPLRGFPSGGGSLQSKVVRGCSIFQRGCSIFHRLLAFPFVNPCRIAVRQSRQVEWHKISAPCFPLRV